MIRKAIRRIIVWAMKGYSLEGQAHIPDPQGSHYAFMYDPEWMRGRTKAETKLDEEFKAKCRGIWIRPKPEYVEYS